MGTPRKRHDTSCRQRICGPLHDHCVSFVGYVFGLHHRMLAIRGKSSSGATARLARDGFIVSPTLSMQQRNAQKDWIVTIREVVKNNLVIRLSRCMTEAGIRYAVFILAAGGKPGQMELINAVAGIDWETAAAIFDDAAYVLRSYSWVEGAYVLEEAQ